MPKKFDPDSSAMQKGLKLFVMLLSGRRWSLRELAEELNCSKQTVLRLVSQLEAASWGRMMEHKEGNRKYFSLLRPRRQAAIAFDAQKISHLMLCYDFISQILPEGFRRESSEAILLVENYLPEGESRPVSIGKVLSKGHIDYSPFESSLRRLVQAIRESKACEITYRKNINEAGQRFLYAPKALVNYHENIYIGGWRVEKRRPLKVLYEATLALQRIEEALPTSITTINVPEPEGFEDGHFGVMLHEPFTCRVKFAPDLATYVSERIWSSDQQVKHHRNGSLTLSMTSRNIPETVAWLLSFGSAARVMSPKWLADKIKDTASATAQQYPGSNDDPLPART